MPTEFNDASHYGFFLTGTTLTSSTGKYARMSELVLSCLRAQGLLDSMEDGTTAPATNKLWLDKNTDPAVLKEWDATGSSWQPMTFQRLFGRAIVTPFATPTGTGNAIVVAQPTPFIANRMYSLTPIADNSGAATIQVTGVGTYNVRYPDGTALEAQELKAGNPTVMLFTGSRFEVLFKVADIYQARDEAVAAATALPAITANTMLVDNAAGTARQAKTFAEVNGKLGVFETEADASAATIDATINRVRLEGSVTLGDGHGGLYIDTNNGSTDTFTSNGGGRTWYRVADVGEDRLSAAVAERLPGYWSDVLDNADWFGGVAYPAMIRLGEGAAASVTQDSTSSRDIIAFGPGALNVATTGTNLVAIGGNTMSQAQPGSHNVAIGASAGTRISSAGGGLNGSRNVALGTLSLHFLSTGYQNVAIGRNAGQCWTTGHYNTAVGYNAGASGRGPIGLDGLITNQYPGTASDMTAVGAACLSLSAANNTGIGASAGRYVKSGSLNVFAGVGAGGNLDIDLSENGKVLTSPALAGTYAQSGTTITVTATANGAVVGNKVLIRFTTGDLSVDTNGDAQWLSVVTKPSADVFTLTSPVSKTASGAVVIDAVETSTTRTPSSTNTIVGVDAFSQSTTLQAGTAVGWQAGYSATGNDNTFVGQRSGYNVTTGGQNTAVGVNAGRGAGITTYRNWSCLGADTVVTGSNQVQLGNSSTTTYVYGTVQNRSDARDKADIRDTTLGLEFISALRPVDYRWDMRDDYYDEDADGNRTPLPRDGTKKRCRYHHGLIAQDVKRVMDALGVDFGGYQDHSVSGGKEILTIGYDELIGPLIKAVQELTARVAALEAR